MEPFGSSFGTGLATLDGTGLDAESVLDEPCDTGWRWYAAQFACSVCFFLVFSRAPIAAMAVYHVGGIVALWMVIAGRVEVTITAPLKALLMGALMQMALIAHVACESDWPRLVRAVRWAFPAAIVSQWLFFLIFRVGGSATVHVSATAALCVAAALGCAVRLREGHALVVPAACAGGFAVPAFSGAFLDAYNLWYIEEMSDYVDFLVSTQLLMFLFPALETWARSLAQKGAPGTAHEFTPTKSQTFLVHRTISLGVPFVAHTLLEGWPALGICYPDSTPFAAPLPRQVLSLAATAVAWRDVVHSARALGLARCSAVIMRPANRSFMVPVSVPCNEY
jgi:hypothetical protein